jgi:hypothetical protein
MRHAANGHLETAGHFFHHGDMFFLGCIRRVFRHEFHGLIATHKLSHARVKYFYDIAAYVTFVDFVSVSHHKPPCFIMINLLS